MPSSGLFHYDKMEPCELHIWRTAWAGVMILGIKLGPDSQMTLLSFKESPDLCELCHTSNLVFGVVQQPFEQNI